MQSNKVHRGTALISGVFVNFFIVGAWILSLSDIHEIYTGINDKANFITINIIGLWVPVGIIGAIIFCLASPIVAFVTGKRSDTVWGDKGQKIFNVIALSFSLIGLVTAIYMYQSLSKQLDELQYSYCSSLTRVSAMGIHKVYVSKPELCSKSNSSEVN